jgi:hypothetical protein
MRAPVLVVPLSLCPGSPGGWRLLRQPSIQRTPCRQHDAGRTEHEAEQNMTQTQSPVVEQTFRAARASLAFMQTSVGMLCLLAAAGWCRRLPHQPSTLAGEPHDIRAHGTAMEWLLCSPRSPSIRTWATPAQAPARPPRRRQSPSLTRRSYGSA